MVGFIFFLLLRSCFFTLRSAKGLCFFPPLKQVEEEIDNPDFWHLTPVLLPSET